MTFLLNQGFGQHWETSSMCLVIYIYFEHILFKKLSKAWVAMVIVNVHVFDFLIHLSLKKCDISLK